MDSVISIIVPVYNVGTYLRKCVDSLVKQTYQNIEIVLIDDGSTDGSGLLCDELKKIDKRIIVYHKKNGGLSDARNAGINVSKGDYITFVDGDDYLDTKACEVLISAAKRNQSRIVVAGLMLEWENGIVDKEKPLCDTERNMSSNESLKHIFEGRGYSACGKLYSRELFSEIQFPKGKLDEDFAIMYKLFIKSETITYIPDYVYFYYKRPGSITKSNFTVKKLDFVENAKDATKYISERFPDSELSERVNTFLCNRINMVIHLIIFDEDRLKYQKELIQLVNLLRSYWKIVLCSKYIDKKDRMVMISEMINPELFRRYKTLKTV